MKNGLIPEERRKDYAAAGIILAYCVIWVALRLLVSPTMELDEAEQFIAAKALALGYADQPPLFTWLFKAASLPFGMNIGTILAVKYALLFCFYFSFYRIARTFWAPGKSLVVTGSLLLFPTYSYEFNRNLTHTILLAAMASVTLLVFVRLLQKKTASRYLLLGAVIGLGILSKYNFLFLLFALALASLSTREGREVLIDKRVLLSAIISLLIVFPHFLWLIQAHFPSVREAFGKAGAGALKGGSPFRAISVILSSFVEALAFPVVFLLFFRGRAQNSPAPAGPVRSVLGRVPLYGLLPPLVVIPLFHMGHFSGKWLTPVFFSIPLALFSFFETPEKPLKLFGRLCVTAAVTVFVLRAFTGFFPDVTGKVERIHVPFRAVSRELTAELQQRGVRDMKKVIVLTDDTLFAGNLSANIPEAVFVTAGRRVSAPAEPGMTVVAVWDANEEGPALPEAFRSSFPAGVAVAAVSAPYIHSKESRPFLLGTAFALTPGA